MKAGVNVLCRAAMEIIRFGGRFFIKNRGNRGRNEEGRGFLLVHRALTRREI